MGSLFKIALCLPAIWLLAVFSHLALAQSCPPLIDVEPLQEARLSEAERVRLGSVITGEYRIVCQKQRTISKLRKFIVVPDRLETYRLPTGTAVRLEVSRPVKYYPHVEPGVQDVGFVAIRATAARGLLSDGNRQLLQTEISRSFSLTDTTGGDEDVEEGAPVDGAAGAASAAAAGTGCVERGRLIPSRPENCTVGDIVALITEVVLPFFLNIAGGIAIIMILWGAFQYFMAYGDPQKIDAGKKTLTWAIIGLIVIIAARAIITYSCEFFAADQTICNVNIRESS